MGPFWRVSLLEHSSSISMVCRRDASEFSELPSSPVRALYCCLRALAESWHTAPRKGAAANICIQQTRGILFLHQSWVAQVINTCYESWKELMWQTRNEIWNTWDLDWHLVLLPTKECEWSDLITYLSEEYVMSDPQRSWKDSSHPSKFPAGYQVFFYHHTLKWKHSTLFSMNCIAEHDLGMTWKGRSDRLLFLKALQGKKQTWPSAKLYSC